MLETNVEVFFFFTCSREELWSAHTNTFLENNVQYNNVVCQQRSSSDQLLTALYTEAEFLDITGNKVFRVFPLCYSQNHSHLY
jgi:hypothetical protein